MARLTTKSEPLQEVVSPPLESNSLTARHEPQQLHPLYLSVFFSSFCCICALLLASSFGARNEEVETCERGNGQQCYEKGLQYLNGHGVTRDHLQSRRYFQLGCHVDHVRSCIGLGNSLALDTNNEKDRAQGTAMLQKLCAEGEAPACNSIGYLHQSAQEYQLANKYFQQACNDNFVNSCVFLAENYTQGLGFSKNPSKAVETHKKACLLDSSFGCLRLGELLSQSNDGVTQNLREANRYLRQACHLKNNKGCLKLAKNLAAGRGEPQDLPGAVELFKLTCERGHGQGCLELGRAHMVGQYGLEVDKESAFQPLMTACAKQKHKACVNLGILYLFGDVPSSEKLTPYENKEKARRYFLDNCERKSVGDTKIVDGCYFLGRSHWKSAKTTHDYDEASKWFRKACINKHEKACWKLAVIHKLGKSSKGTASQDTKLFQMLCESGNMAGCLYMGYRSEVGKRDAFFRRACDGQMFGGCEAQGGTRSLRIGCDGGHGGSCLKLAQHFHYRSYNSKQNALKAKVHYQQACILGVAKACTSIKSVRHKRTNRVLTMAGESLRDLEVQELLQSQSFEGITSLRLGNNEIGDSGVQAIANTPALQKIHELDISQNKITSKGVRAIMESPHLVQLRRLFLNGNKIGDEGARILAQLSPVAALNNLALGYFKKGLRLPGLVFLQRLYLGSCDIGDDGLLALSHSLGLKRLRVLHLERNRIGPGGAKTLATSENMPSIAHLDLSHNRVGDGGAIALAEGTLAASLRTLHLENNDIGNEGARALAQSSNLKNLTKLNLKANTIGAVGRKALETSPSLQNCEIQLDQDKPQATQLKAD